MAGESTQGKIPERARRHTSARWPAMIAILVMLGIYAVTPPNLIPRAILIVLSAVIILTIFVFGPRRHGREADVMRWAAIVLSILLLASNLIDVVYIVHDLIAGTSKGPQVLLEAAEVWTANVIAFSVVYWEMDRGGPVARGLLARAQLPEADFKFPQDDERAAVIEVEKDSSSSAANWRPGYIDFLYLALTNMMAFTPNDVVPLTARAKILMGVQGLSGFVILALVIGRSVNILA